MPCRRASLPSRWPGAFPRKTGEVTNYEESPGACRDSAAMHSSIARGLLHFALSRGMTIEDLKQAAGVPPERALVPESRLPDEPAIYVWQALVAREPNVALSVLMAQAAPFSMMAGLADGSQFAGDLETALRLMSEHGTILADRLDLHLEVGPDETFFVSSHPLDGKHDVRLNEMGMALGHRVIQEILGIKDYLRRVELRFAPQGPSEAYEQHFGVPVLFGRPRSALVLITEALGRPTRQANLELFRFVQNHFAEVLREVRERSRPSEFRQLREAIAQNVAAGEFSPAAAADRAQLSLRSAQRRAVEHGTTVQALIDDVREDTAKRLLRSTDQSIDRIAQLVGYSDDRAFRRAFKRWTGLNPSHFRLKGRPA